MINLFHYIDRPSPIHRMTGAGKLVCLLLWSVAAMTSFMTPLLAAMGIGTVILFRISRIRLKEVGFLLGFTIVFMVLNNVLIFLFSPEHGVKLYGSRTVLLPPFGPYVITAEQLFYHLNVCLKYLCTIPIVLLFLCTTNPSEFAASLNRIGISYRISYAVALSLRYIPDVQREYQDISLAQQARGVEMSKKASPIDRLKRISGILIPLILRSMERIETTANAMELRGFGKNKGRTWYAARPFGKADAAAITVCVLLMVLSLALAFFNGSRFFNPFL